MSKGWEEEVQEILQKAGELEVESRRHAGRRHPANENKLARGNILTTLGDQVFKRVATSRDMATSGALLIAAGLICSVTPMSKIVSPVLALLGCILLVGAYVRSLMGRSPSAASAPKMWRGRVIDLESSRRHGFLDRLFLWLRRIK